MKKNNYFSKTWVRALIVTLCLLGVVLAVSAYVVFFSAFSAEEHAVIYVREGDTADDVYRQVSATAHPRTMTLFRWLCRAKGYERSVRPGRYDLGGGIGVLTAVSNLRSGAQTPVMLTVPATHTTDRLAAKIARHLRADSAEFARAFRDTLLLDSLGVTRATLPTLFLPNTYEVYWTITPRQFLWRMKRERDRFWEGEREERAREIGFTPEEVCVLASIVDQETRYKPEKPTIAGLYINRVRKGMKLEADPTVKFAMQNFGLRRVLRRHLDTDSPYNTYRYAGLPPGPICIAEGATIDDVLHYKPSDYLFMCAKEDFSGSHNFARTFAEHDRNAKRYAAALNERGIR
ncbi:MAG: endolytic transglycosylase MltG [Bacteroidaceae bacterium]|nr:endolytic transglycosylase MltG [Bacteroidaceae bacterium]